MPVGTITALRAQHGHHQRVNIFLDGEFALGVSLTTVAREQLAVGHYIDAAQWERLEAAEYADRAVQTAMRYVQTRPRSIAEVRARLRRSDLPAAAIEHAVTRLTELEMLDDAAFARFWVENRNVSRPRGPRALRAELMQKGVDREIIDRTLADTDLMGDEYERALTLARGRLTQYARAPDRATFQRRLGGYLQRRGFSSSVIMPILDQLWREILAART
jgi:regulatory protein